MKKMWPIYIFTFFQCYCLEYKGIDMSYCKALAYASFVLMWGYTVLLKKRNKKNVSGRRTINVLHIIALAITLSILPAYFIEGQSIGISFMTTISYIFVMLMYDIWKRLGVDPYQLEKLIVLGGFVYVGVVITNIFTFPDMLFGSGELDLERGGIRMRSNMLMFGVFSYFYFLNKYLIKGKGAYLLYAFIMFVAVASSFFRVFILLMLGLGAFMILHNSSLRKRIWILVTLFLLFFIIIPQTDVYKNLVEVSKAQKDVSDNSQEDIRIQGNRYFFIESQVGLGSVLLGHGIASIGHSEYGKREEARQRESHIYQADAGWGGIFHDYGIIATLGFAYLLVYGYLRKKGQETRYLSYFYILNFTAAFAHGVLQIPIMLYVLVTSFYILDFKPKSYNLYNQGDSKAINKINKRI